MVMAQTGAQRQAAWRKRRARRVAALEAENARLTAERDGLADECARLARLACRHPAGAVDGHHCHACGNDIG